VGRVGGCWSVPRVRNKGQENCWHSQGTPEICSSSLRAYYAQHWAKCPTYTGILFNLNNPVRDYYLLFIEEGKGEVK
jgi:hypothetical protein